MIHDPHAFLDGLSPSTMKFGLDRMRSVDAALGHPWKRYRVLHVAGTNGKGSTCAFAEAILRAHGLKVGLYTSPHLERVNERIRVDGQDITDAELAEALSAVCAAYPPGGEHPDALTYFEMLTAVALWFFQARGVDVAIIEVGLGGRLDGTNVLIPTACAIATISFDHQAILGNSLAQIGAEKAGILKPGVPGAVLTREPEALAAIERVAAEVGAPLRHFGADFSLEGEVLRVGERQVPGIQLALAGAHQRGNAALAAQAALLVEPGLSDDALRSGLASARWPGRLESIDGVLLDGAHNIEGARALAAHLETLGRPVHLVFGALADKDVGPMVDALAPRAKAMYLVPPDSSRALAPDAYLDRARAHTPAQAYPGLGSALAAARTHAALDGGQVVVAGSLYLVGPARHLLYTPLGAARHAL